MEMPRENAANTLPVESAAALRAGYAVHQAGAGVRAASRRYGPGSVVSDKPNEPGEPNEPNEPNELSEPDEARSGLSRIGRFIRASAPNGSTAIAVPAGVPARENKPAIACDAGDQKIDRPVSVVNCSSA